MGKKRASQGSSFLKKHGTVDRGEERRIWEKQGTRWMGEETRVSAREGAVATRERSKTRWGEIVRPCDVQYIARSRHLLAAPAGTAAYEDEDEEGKKEGRGEGEGEAARLRVWVVQVTERRWGRA